MRTWRICCFREPSRGKKRWRCAALGAARGRLLRQLLTESLLLSALGGCLGLLAAWVLIATFARAKSPTLPQFNIIQLNGEVLAFTFALATLTGASFGIVPALRTSRPDVHDELKGGAGSSVSPGRRRRFTSNVLVVAEIALSLLLLVCAGLLLKDFARLRALDIGVRTEGVLTAAVRLPDARYKTAQQQFNFSQALLEKSSQVAGVDATAITDHLPLEGGSNYYVTLRGQTSRRSSNVLVGYHTVSTGYFHAMGVRLLEGRVFTGADVQSVMALHQRWEQRTEGGSRPAPDESNAIVYPSVINESMARHFWPNRSPLGQMFSSGNVNGPWKQVVGVVNDVREGGITHGPVPEAYEVFDGRGRLFLVLHTSLQPASLTPQVRRVLGQVDSSLPLYSVRTMNEVIADSAQGQQFLSLLVGAFAALAVLLAAVGIYGVLSYVVTQRTREIGIRMSLGASRGRVLGEVMKEGMRLAAAGFVVGIAGALAAGRVLASLLHEVKPGDPAVLAGTGGFLAIVALIACYVPARRAARLEPTTALRYE